MRTAFGFFVIFVVNLITAQVPDPAQCQPKITQCIQKIGPCNAGKDLLKKGKDLGEFTFLSNSADFGSNVKCIKGKYTSVSQDGSTASLDITFSYKDGTKPKVLKYTQKLTRCWEIQETDSSGKIFYLYIFPVSGCTCYHRCSNFKSGGAANVAIGIKTGTEKLKQTQDCINTCKKLISSCKVNAKFNPLTPCS